MAETTYRLYRPTRRRRRSRLAVAGVTLALLVGAAGVFVLARAVILRNDVLPGVSVAGVDVGGLDRSEARARIQRVLGARLDRHVLVHVGSATFRIRPAVVYELDAAATVERAFAAGRSTFSSRVRAAALPFAFDEKIEPVLVPRPDGPRRLAAKVERVTNAPVSAQLSMDGTGPVLRPGRTGTAVDEAALAESLRRAGLAGATEVEASITRVRPEITTQEANAAFAQAETIVSAPVALELAGARVGELAPSLLAELLRFQPAEGGYRVLLDADGLRTALAPLVADRTAAPVDASFRIEGDRVRVIPSHGGTRVAPRKAAAAVLTAALSPDARAASLALTKADADLTTKEAKALGIREEISTFTTDMGASSSNRIHNVHLLGDYLDGTILRPGEEFSFNRVMGPRTPERGFLEGQMIFAGVLIPSIGGGVCQTATTIFNAAFEAGLPIEERVNHSFYISHYPMGRDATVSWGGPDLRFGNDLDHAILIKASYTDETFTVTLYGTDQHRKVVTTTTEPTNYTAPKLQFAIDPTAPAGSVRTTAAGQSGFDVSVHRKVYEDGKLIREATFFTRYTPENPTKVFGPGADAPDGAVVLPTSD